MTFIDDYSRCGAVYFMKQKSEVLKKFKEFETDTTSGSSRRIGALRTDNGGEYLSKDFMEYLQMKRIRHERTVPHTPEQNGIAERMNRTLMESARAMMAHAGLPGRNSSHSRNRTPTTAIKTEKTPYERWYG